MVRVKSRSPSPSGGGGAEEFEGFDLYTPDTLRLVGSDDTPANSRKRSSTVSSSSPPAKRTCTPNSVSRASTISRATANSGASPASKKKKAGQAKAPPQPRPKVPKLIFGFDFGTTFSGISYAYSTDANNIEVIMSWDDTNEDHVKIPSVIDFASQNVIWGLEAKDLPDALRWFKLALVNPSDLDVGVRDSAQLRDARQALHDLGMSPVEVISSYMKHLWNYCIEKLKVAEGEETVDTSRFHVVFTVPAIWPNYARQAMEKAVKDAGILKRRTAGRTEHEFVSEPEAAALATLSGIDGRHNIEVNDIFVVVDVGGGTADVISYKAIETDPMIVQEAVKGKGDLCGAIFVDERFKALLMRKLQEICEDAMERVSDEEIQKIMSQNWENEIRSQFSGAARTWTVHVPYSLIDADLLDPNHGYPTFIITSAEVEEVFRPILKKIYSLANRQITAAVKKEGRAPKYVILVGGFGGSKYLREYLKQHCHGVEILQRRGSKPWSAISRGAVIHGMTNLKLDTPFTVGVRSRISRANYGAVCEELWDGALHSPEDKTFNPILQRDVSSGVMKWHVVQGQDICVDCHPSFKFTKFLAEPPEKIVTTIYRSLEEVPPARKDDSVNKIFDLTWNIQVDWESLEVFVNDRQETFKKLEYTVEMKCSAGTTVFSIYHAGYKQASKNVALKVYETADI